MRLFLLVFTRGLGVGGGQSQDQDGDLSVGIPITSSTGRFQLLHVITWELSLGFHLHRREEADWYKPLI